MRTQSRWARRAADLARRDRQPVAPPAAKRTPLSEDQVRAAIGVAFFAVATFYVVSQSSG